MNAFVELRVFSGISNPIWMLSLDDEARFARWLHEVDPSDQPSGPIIEQERVPRVGYTGFVVRRIGKPPVHVYWNALRRRAAPPSPFKTIDEFLFATNERDLYQDYGLDARILEPVTPRPIRNLPAGCSFTHLHCGPTVYEHPSIWDGDTIKSSDACFNYATNVVTLTRVDPLEPRRWDIEPFQAALCRDHLILLQSPPTACPIEQPSHYLCALLHRLGNPGDFHFLRLDQNGFWSHKNGGDAATNLDDAGNTIGDLCQSTFAADYHFVGFFISTEKAQKKIKRRG